MKLHMENHCTLSMNQAMLYMVIGILLAGVCFTPLAKAQSGREDLETAIQKLRTLYQDTYPTFEQISVLRDAGETDRAGENVQELREEVSTRLDDIRQIVTGIQTDNRPVQRKVQEVKKVIAYFDQYQKKFLSDWEPENPQLYEAFNRRELISRGIASPDMLRQQFLSELTSMVHNRAYVREDVPEKNLNKYARQVQKTYRKVLVKFLKLLDRVEQAMNDEDQEVEEVIQEAEEEWNTFWSEFEADRSALENGINRVLSLYREQDQKYLSSIQEANFKQGTRVKREFSEILEFQRKISSNEVFSSQEAVRDLLVMMAKKYTIRLSSLLREQKAPYMAMLQKFLQNRMQLEDPGDQETFEERQSNVDRWLSGVYGEFDLEGSLERIRRIPGEALSILTRRLTTRYGKKEKQLGTVLENLRSFSGDLVDFATRARRVTEEYVERYKQVSFESPEQFQREFPGPVEENIQEVNQKRQKLNQRLRNIDKQVKEALQLDYQLSKSQNGQSG